MQARWMKILFGALLSVLLVSGCGAGNDQEQAPADEGAGEAPAEDEAGDAAYDEAAAEEAYSGTCASCHGGNLEGSVGPSLEQVGAKYSQDEILDIINNGTGQMPPQSDAVDEDAKQDLAAWLADQK